MKNAPPPSAIPSGEELYENIPESWMKIQTPARVLMFGPSTSGKSLLLARMLQHKEQVFNRKFKRIFYIYPDYMHGSRVAYLQKLRESTPEIELIAGLEQLPWEELKYDSEPKLLLIDDLIDELCASKDVCSLFNRDSHHFNLTYVITVQSYFFKSPVAGEAVNLRRGATDIILFKNRADETVLGIVARTKVPKTPQLLYEAMDWLEANDYDRVDQYLVIDAHPMSRMPKGTKVRTDIIPKRNGKLEPIYFSQ